VVEEVKPPDARKKSRGVERGVENRPDSVLPPVRISHSDGDNSEDAAVREGEGREEWMEGRRCERVVHGGLPKTGSGWWQR